MGMLFVESKLMGRIAYNGGTINVYENDEVHARHGTFGNWQKFKTIGAAKRHITKYNNIEKRLNFLGIPT